MDPGVAQDFIGQFSKYLLEQFPGRGKEEQCADLWLRVVALYERYPCDSLLASSRLDMLMRTSETAAKLRTPPNAEASFPWRATLQSDDDVLDNTVRTAMCV